MSNDTKPIMCGKCDSPVNVRMENDIKREVFCPKCGNSSDYDSAMKIIQQSFTEQAAAQFQKSIRNSFGNSKGFKLKQGVTINPSKQDFYIRLDI